MGNTIVGIVVDALNTAGIPAGRAAPGGMMPQVKSTAAAVWLQELDQKDHTAQVLVSVLVPSSMGAGACEDSALQVGRLLQSKGGVCRQEKAAYLSDSDLFCVNVCAVFEGEETAQGWIAAEAAPSFTVAIGDTVLNRAVSFTAQREVDETVTALSAAPWQFRLEEEFPLDGQETVTPEEPFSLSVSRSGQTETYFGCTVTSHKRVISGQSLLQVREGAATERTVT